MSGGYFPTEDRRGRGDPDRRIRDRGSADGPTLEVPDAWADPYTALAEEMNFPVADVGDAAAQVRRFTAEIDAS